MAIKLKKIITCAAVSAAVLISAATYALPKYATEIVYYSDASMTVEVGQKSLTCMGTTVLEGQKTNHYIYLVKESCQIGGGGL